MKIILAKNAISSLINYSNSIVSDGEFFSDIPKDIKWSACLSVIKNITEKRYFDVRDVDKLCELHWIIIQSEHRIFLSSMHCIDWGKMEKKVREYILALIVKYFEQPLTNM